MTTKKSCRLNQTLVVCKELEITSFIQSIFYFFLVYFKNLFCFFCAILSCFSQLCFVSILLSPNLLFRSILFYLGSREFNTLFFPVVCHLGLLFSVTFDSSVSILFGAVVFSFVLLYVVLLF